MNVMRLEVDFRGYWHAGTGRGSGHHLDALVCRDACDLPYLPGKTLRGLLRDALGRLEEWGGAAAARPGITKELFGSTAWEYDEGAPVTRDATEPGKLFVSDARLPADVSAWLALEDNAPLRAGLFREHFSTAMTEQGIAREKSLRGLEVAVPLILNAEVRLLPGCEASGWKEALNAALPLVRAAGAHRSRGLGRCVIREVSHG